MIKFFRNSKIYLILALILFVAIVLLLNKFIIYGLILLGVLLVVFSIWSAFIKNNQEEIGILQNKLNEEKSRNSSLKSENNELRNRKLNISALKNILDLGLMEIDSNFTRTYNNKFKNGDKDVHFIGALHVKIGAKYGVDLRELNIKVDSKSNTIIVANINPKFLSFSNLEYHWKIAEIMEYKKPFIGTNHWIKSSGLQGLCGRIQEDFRVRTNEEIKNGPEELNWVINPLRKQIENALQILLGSEKFEVKFTSQCDDSFKSLEEYFKNNV